MKEFLLKIYDTVIFYLIKIRFIKFLNLWRFLVLGIDNK